MTSGLPENRRIFLRAFYGFNPEEDGYVGWTKERARDSFLGKVADGDLIMIYGASTAETKRSLRAYVLGFLEVEARPILDRDKASPTSLQRKRDNGWAAKWTYGIPVRRAWHAIDKMLISRIAINSYRAEAGQSLAVHGAELGEVEVARALEIRVRETNVYGEEAVKPDQTTITRFSEIFTPSRAFPISFGSRTSNYQDGQTYLYLAVFEGDGHALIGRQKFYGDKSAVMKIGISNDLERRCAELNAGIPPAAQGRWKIRLRSQAFPDGISAQRAEDAFKKRYIGKLESLSGEFFWGRIEATETLCWTPPGMSRF